MHVVEGLEKMKKLPVEEWWVRFYPDFIAVAAHLNGGGLYWTKYRLSDFPQDLIGLEDLKRLFVNVVDARAINQGPLARSFRG
jgi:hypothetical protein